MELYGQQVRNLRLGTIDGHPAPSKPIFLLSIIDSISTKCLRANEILFYNKLLQGMYKMLYEYYINALPKYYLPFFIRPYFHLSSEPFYELVWKRDSRPPMLSHTPSARYLREHLAYAKLDDDLWLLLQDSGNREYFKEVITDQYLRQYHG